MVVGATWLFARAVVDYTEAGLFGLRDLARCGLCIVDMVISGVLALVGVVFARFFILVH